jgi:hypothetical protein
LDSSAFFRLGYFRYAKLNAYVDEFQYLGLRQENDKWYKIDLIMDWTSNFTTMYVNNKYATSADFYHGKDKFHISKGVMPDHEGASALMLYTLSPEATSTFKNIKVCKTRCFGGESFVKVKTNDHYEDDPNELLRRRRLEQNNA